MKLEGGCCCDNASPLEFIDSLRKLAALDWGRMIPGHPQAGGRLGTKKDVEDDMPTCRTSPLRFRDPD